MSAHINNKRFVSLTVKNGVVRWRGKTYKCGGPGEELNGLEFVFSKPPGNVEHLFLWGTPRFYRAEYDSKEQDEAWNEMLRLIAKPDGEAGYGSMQTWSSKGFEHWNPQTTTIDTKTRNP